MAEYISYYITSVSFDTDASQINFLEDSVPVAMRGVGSWDEATFSLGEMIYFFDIVGQHPAIYHYFLTNGDGWIGYLQGNPVAFTLNPYSANSHAGYSEGDFIVCFLAGTAISTPCGARSIEDLKIGDLVSTADGGTAPVRWVGRRTVSAVFTDPLSGFPIHLSPGSLGEGVPARDLFVSPDHALLVGGVLVHAGALVNGATIIRAAAPGERFTYYHVELDSHALILAEGVPAETFVDNVTRRRFDNYAEYESLYGRSCPRIAEMDLPRVKSARQLPRTLRDRLAVRGGTAMVA
jgi:hypothetical protein